MNHHQNHYVGRRYPGRPKQEPLCGFCGGDVSTYLSGKRVCVSCGDAETECECIVAAARARLARADSGTRKELP